MLLFVGCNFDPYSGKRPFDYGESMWMCITDDYSVSFNVDLETKDYYYPEGELSKENITYFCKFYFIHQTNQLSILVYPLEYKDILDDERNREAVLFELNGECDFNPNSFTVNLEESKNILFNQKVEKLEFKKL